MVLCVQEPPIFPRVEIRMESCPDKVFWIHEYVLHSSSLFYEGLVNFYAREADGHSQQKTVTIQSETLTDPR